VLKTCAQPFAGFTPSKVSQAKRVFFSKFKDTPSSIPFFPPPPRLSTGRMAHLAGRPRPLSLIGTARRDRGKASTNIMKPSTDRLRHQPSSPLPLAVPPLNARPRLHRRNGQRTLSLVTFAAAAAGGDIQQQQLQQQQLLTFQQRLAAAQAAKKKRPPLPARLLSSFLATSTVPYR
jgi:hypothetical protein